MFSHPLLKTSAAGRKGRLEIYDTLGPSWGGMIDAKAVAAELKKLGDVDTIEVHINSPGGSAWEGLAIASILRDHPAKIEVVVDGIAASAASLIVMIGDSVRIPANALLMIHDPWSIAMGGEDDFRAAINQLTSVKKASIDLYAKRTGKSESVIAALMKAETWYTGDEAVAEGFADEITNAPVVPAASLNLLDTMTLFHRPPANLHTLLMQRVEADATPAVPPFGVGSDTFLVPSRSKLLSQLV